ncbi:MAG: acyl-CoA dehydrogenase family protein [Alphaproteobacteria bacterium]|nr:acyl-CoA dehydrogenase family protein [Alphaproteobacteria bacterium]MCY4319061.1 acyl-CoA dehydrogenase family protein [Alphaproteobacteria bacterium]
MQLEFTDEERAFAEEVDAFFQANLDSRLSEQVRRNPSYVSKEDMRAWQKALYERGWIAPNWPEEYGGAGWTPTQKFIFEEAYQRHYAPRLSPFGLMMVGPVIYTFGSEAQKAQHLPAILKSDVFWCQGYSEPGSGSDLASLKTRAVWDGGDYVVNGSKIWTSSAHNADWIFALVRTGPEAAKPQQGISFLLIDMATPGIEVRPIVSIDGGHYLNQVFFTDVRVPTSNRVGEENKGWTYAKFLLGNERTGIAGVAKSRMKVERLKEIACIETGAGGGPLGDDPEFRARLGGIEARLGALEIVNLRTLAAEEKGGSAGPEASILKICGTEIEQALNEMLVEAVGIDAIPYSLEWTRLDSNEEPSIADHAVGLMSEHLLKRAATIYGGTNEIQRNIVAKHVLGL